MNKIVVGGLLALAGCSSVDDKLVQEVKNLNTSLDRLIRVASYHDGQIAMTHRDYEMAAEKFSIALRKFDSPHYRIARFEANIHLAELSEDDRKELYQRCHEDADAYIRQLPHEPDGYVAKATALYQEYANLGGKPERLEAALENLKKVKTLVEEEHRRLIHFSIAGVNALAKKIRYSPREY